MLKFDWPIIGQDKITKYLQKSLVNNKLAHAYLFTGPQYLGKGVMAENFIASILCYDYHLLNKSKINQLPCGTCVFCQQLNKKIHPDVYFLDKEDDKKNITVEQVRKMQKVLNMASFLNSYKIALVKDGESLNESAQNALLKILEEPKSKTILIILVKDSNSLLPTINSRCQKITFSAVSQSIIYEHLLSLGANREQAQIFSALAHGKIGFAVELLQNPDLFNEYLAKIEKIIKFLQSSIAERFMLLQTDSPNLTNNNAKIDYWQSELDVWQLFLRDILITQHNLDNLLTNISFQAEIAQFAREMSADKVLALIKQVRQIKKYLSVNLNPMLAMENLVLNF